MPSQGPAAGAGADYQWQASGNPDDYRVTIQAGDGNGTRDAGAVQPRPAQRPLVRQAVANATTVRQQTAAHQTTGTPLLHASSSPDAEMGQRLPVQEMRPFRPPSTLLLGTTWW